MKKFLRLAALSMIIPAAPAFSQCLFTVTDSIVNASCANSNDGAIYTTISGGIGVGTSTRPLLISQVHANATGTDAPFEFVELLATKSIDFSVTPYTVIFSNNGAANTNGWVAGAALTYAFQINSGSVIPGDVIYVGGSSMIPTLNVFRSINTATTAGDGGIGNASASGNLGNGGANADGVAVFDMAVASVTSSSVPIDAVFWGTAAGTAVVSAGSAGYELPVNDSYSGGKLQTTSFLAPDQASVVFLTATGVYDIQSNTFTTPRTWTNSGTFTNLTSGISLSSLYTISWSPVSSTSNNLTGLAPGTYTLTVTDGQPCTQTFTYTVNGPSSPLSAVATSTSASCVCDGSVSVSVSGGTAPYTYQWSSGCTTNSCTNLCAGPYSVIVTDSMGCVDSAATSIISIGGPQVTFSATNNCTSIDECVIVTGGTAPYTFTWSTGATTMCIPILIPGVYCVTVADAVGCITTECDTISQSMIPTGPQPNLGPDTVVCPPMNLTFNPGNFVTYLWHDGTTASTYTLVSSTATLPDTLYVTVTDSAGCTGIDSVIVDICVGFNEIQLSQVRVFADASGNMIFVQADEMMNAQVQVFDISGRAVTASEQMRGKNMTINVSSLRDGIYFVQLLTASGNRVQQKILLHRN